MRLCTFIIDARDADVIGDEPIFFGGEARGWVTSGGYAHASGKSVAVGYVPKEIADKEDGWSIELLGDMLGARLQPRPLFRRRGREDARLIFRAAAVPPRQPLRLKSNSETP